MLTFIAVALTPPPLCQYGNLRNATRIPISLDRMLTAGLRNLSDAHRVVVMLVDVDGLTCQEAARRPRHPIGHRHEPAAPRTKAPARATRATRLSTGGAQVRRTPRPLSCRRAPDTDERQLDRVRRFADELADEPV
jgi:hypothetical protein